MYTSTYGHFRQTHYDCTNFICGQSLCERVFQPWSSCCIDRIMFFGRPKSQDCNFHCPCSYEQESRLVMGRTLLQQGIGLDENPTLSCTFRWAKGVCLNTTMMCSNPFMGREWDRKGMKGIYYIYSILYIYTYNQR